MCRSDTLVVHPVTLRAGCRRKAQWRWWTGRYVEKPLITTGAGDHFNSGFCLGKLLGFRQRRLRLDRRDDQRLLCAQRRKARASMTWRDCCGIGRVRRNEG